MTNAARPLNTWSVGCRTPRTRKARRQYQEARREACQAWREGGRMAEDDDSGP